MSITDYVGHFKTLNEMESRANDDAQAPEASMAQVTMQTHNTYVS